MGSMPSSEDRYEVFLNGESVSVPSGMTLSAFLSDRVGADGLVGVAVSVDDRVVVRGAWEGFVLKPGSRVVIFTIARGG